MHYCMSELVSRSLWQGDEGKCPGCGMKKDESNNCCKDEQKQFKLSVEHKKAIEIVQVNVEGEQLPLSATELIRSTYKFIVQNNLTDYKPPPPLFTSLHILNCIYRI